MVSCLLSCSFSDLMLLAIFDANLYYEVELFIRLASVSLFPAFWTFSQFLSIWHQLIRNEDSKNFLVVKDS